MSSLSTSRASSLNLAAPTKANLATLILLISLIIGFQDMCFNLFKQLHEVKFINAILTSSCLIVLYFKYKNKVHNIVSIPSSPVLLFILALCLILSITTLLDSHILSQFLLLSLVPFIFWLTHGNKSNSIMFWPLLTVYGLLPIQEEFGHIIYNFVTKNVIQLLAFKTDIFWHDAYITINNFSYKLSFLRTTLNYAFYYCIVAYTISNLLTLDLKRKSILITNFIVTPLLLLIFSLTLMLAFKLPYTDLKVSIVTIYVLSFISVMTLTMIICKNIPNKNTRQIDWHNTYRFSKSNWLKPTIVAICIILTTPYITHYLETNIVHRKGTPTIMLPKQIGTWVQDVATSEHSYNQDTGLTSSAVYSVNGNYIKLTIHAFTNKIVTNKLISNAPHVLHQTIKQLQIKNVKYPIYEKINRNMGANLLHWSFYQVHQRHVATAKNAFVLDQILTALKHERNSYLVELSTVIENDASKMRQILQSFLQDLAPDLNKTNTIYWEIKD